MAAVMVEGVVGRPQVVVEVDRAQQGFELGRVEEADEERSGAVGAPAHDGDLAAAHRRRGRREGPRPASG
jgi:hypothetical protein